MSVPSSADSRAVDVGWRALLVVLAATLAAVGPATVTSWVTTPVCLLAALAAVECLTRRRASGWLDEVAFGVGGLLTALVLVGLLLDVVPGGITRLSWAIALGVIGLLAVAYGTTATTSGLAPRRWVGLPRPSPAALWYAAAAVVVVVAVVVAVSVTRSALRSPLQLSMVGSATAEQQTVRIQGGGASGRYVLAVVQGSRTTAVDGPFSVAAGAAVRREVPVPDNARVRVDLRRYGSAVVIRSLILQRNGTGPAVAGGADRD